MKPCGMLGGLAGWLDGCVVVVVVMVVVRYMIEMMLLLLFSKVWSCNIGVGSIVMCGGVCVRVW